MDHSKPVSEQESSHGKPESQEDTDYPYEEKTKETPPILATELEAGDHIYVWRFGFLYQRHAIVMSNDVKKGISVAEFYPSPSRSNKEYADASSDNEDASSASEEKVKLSSLEEFSRGSSVHKVQYAAPWSSRLIHRSGTVTSAQRDPMPLILARASFLLSNSDKVPPFRALSSNDECICVWISTGTYCTLQVCSYLSFLSISQAKTAMVTAGAVSAMTVTVPASGIWGFLGCTTTVPLISANPVILPLLVGYGLVTLVPLEMLRRFRKKWEEVQKELNAHFEGYFANFGDLKEHSEDKKDK